MPDSSSLVTLQTPLLQVEVDPKGAQLFSLRDGAGRDFLWHGDPKVWAGRSPILFPIVGSLEGGEYRLSGRRYSLPRHGFARGSLFEVVSTAATTATFRLRSSAATLAVYPFRFQLDISYRVENATLAMDAILRNDGQERMPASLGFHPAFLWPLPSAAPRAAPKEAHYLEFEHEEPAPVRRIDAQGLLSPHTHPSPVVGRKLALHDELFRDDVVILDQPNSRRLRYGAGAGTAIQLEFLDARYLGIWTKPGAPFICIEPWQGITDPPGFAGELFEKPGIFTVEPGQSHVFGMKLQLGAAT